MAMLYAKGAELDPALADYFRSFHLIVSYLFDPDGILRDNMEKLGVKTLIDFPQLIVPGQGHASQQLAKPLEKLAMFLEEPEWRRPTFPKRTGKFVLRLAIHPGSGSATKNWPVENWLRLAGEITAAHPQIEIVFITGEAEAERGTLPRDIPFPRWQSLPLTDLADHLSTCILFLGHDSGISHLASACGVPSLLIFGPTDPSTWAPPQPTVRVLRAPSSDLNQLPYEAVRDTALMLLS